MDGKAEADAEEARYVQSKPPLGPKGGSQGIRADIRPGHGESDISRLLRFVLLVLSETARRRGAAATHDLLSIRYVRCG